MTIQEFYDGNVETIDPTDTKYTMDVFKDHCLREIFIDYDGFGRYSDGTNMYNAVIPSDVIQGKLDESYSYVVWFNR